MARTAPIKRTTTLGLAVVVVLIITSIPAFAGKGNNNGRGNGSVAALAASCAVDGTVVSATGLPADEVINFMVTDASGTTGWVLGTSSWWDVNVPERTDFTTYEFVSRTWGPGGSKYQVFASCSAGA